VDEWTASPLGPRAAVPGGGRCPADAPPGDEAAWDGDSSPWIPPCVLPPRWSFCGVTGPGLSGRMPGAYNPPLLASTQAPFMRYAGLFQGFSMTKCVKVLRAKAKAKSMDQSQARIKPFRLGSEPVIGPCCLLLLLLCNTLTHCVIFE